MGGAVENVDAVRRGIDHLLRVGCIGVDVEVESAGVGLVAEPPDAMAGILVHPAARRHGAARCGLRNAGERKQGEGECSNDGRTHRDFSVRRPRREEKA